MDWSLMNSEWAQLPRQIVAWPGLLCLQCSPAKWYSQNLALPTPCSARLQAGATRGNLNRADEISPFEGSRSSATKFHAGRGVWFIAGFGARVATHAGGSRCAC